LSVSLTVVSESMALNGGQMVTYTPNSKGIHRVDSVPHGGGGVGAVSRGPMSLEALSRDSRGDTRSDLSAYSGAGTLASASQLSSAMSPPTLLVHTAARKSNKLAFSRSQLQTLGMLGGCLLSTIYTYYRCVSLHAGWMPSIN